MNTELMEGLTVLSTDTQNGIGAKFLLIVLGSLMCLLGIFVLVFAIMAFTDRETGAGSLMMIFVVGCMAMGAFAFTGASKETRTTYKVTIDENVSFAEFNERYEIIDQDGLIYEIVEKEE